MILHMKIWIVIKDTISLMLGCKLQVKDQKEVQKDIITHTMEMFILIVQMKKEKEIYIIIKAMNNIDIQNNRNRIGEIKRGY